MCFFPSGNFEIGYITFSVGIIHQLIRNVGPFHEREFYGVLILPNKLSDKLHDSTEVLPILVELKWGFSLLGLVNFAKT